MFGQLIWTHASGNQWVIILDDWDKYLYFFNWHVMSMLQSVIRHAEFEHCSWLHSSKEKTTHPWTAVAMSMIKIREYNGMKTSMINFILLVDSYKVNTIVYIDGKCLRVLMPNNTAMWMGHFLNHSWKASVELAMWKINSHFMNFLSMIFHGPKSFQMICYCK